MAEGVARGIETLENVVGTSKTMVEQQAVHHCTCYERSFPACEGEVEADAVYYKDLAYEAQPRDARLGGLVDKMMMDEVLAWMRPRI